MTAREDENMTGEQHTTVEDRIQPHNHQSTPTIEAADPWRTIGPDEVTIRDASEGSERPSYAELIRRMTANYRERELS